MDMSWKTTTPPDESAREPRVSKLMSVDISSARQPRTRIVVRNLSPHGIGCRGECDILPCERITVHLHDGREVGATVRWVRKGTFGLSLDERIDPAALHINTSATGAITPRDADLGFHRLRHQGSQSRTGFQRSHRDEVLTPASGWRAKRIDD